MSSFAQHGGDHDENGGSSSNPSAFGYYDFDPSWKTRDMVYDFLKERESLPMPRDIDGRTELPLSTSLTTTTLTAGTGRGKKAAAGVGAQHAASDPSPGTTADTACSMPLFQYDDRVRITALQRLQRIPSSDAGVLKEAFNTAAMVVLKAIEYEAQTKQHTAASRRRSYSYTRRQEQEQDAAEYAMLERLPPVFREYKYLAELRTESFDRSHNNKEYAKNPHLLQQQITKSITNTAKAATAPASNNKAASAVSNGTNKKVASAKVATTSTKAPVEQNEKKKVKIEEDSHEEQTTSAVVKTEERYDATTGAVEASPSGTGEGVRIKTEHVEGGDAAALAALSDEEDHDEHENNNSTTAAAAADAPDAVQSTTATVPKFTRNTPASSAAALDFRFNSSRAILCAAGNIVFEALTPPSNILLRRQQQLGDDNDEEGGTKTTTSIDVANVPQNPAYNKDAAAKSATGGGGIGSVVNMGAVVVEAQTIGQRTIAVVENAVRRSTARFRYRKINAKTSSRYDPDRVDLFPLANPFSWTARQERIEQRRQEQLRVLPDDDDTDDDGGGGSSSTMKIIPYRPNPDSLTSVWANYALDRFVQVLQRGAGHAIYHDVHWTTRHGRIASLLRALTHATTTDTRHKNAMSRSRDHSNHNSSIDGGNGNYGPHLIVTTQPELQAFCQEFRDLNGRLSLVLPQDGELQVLAYRGSSKKRRDLRKRYFAHNDQTNNYFAATMGLPESPFHVMVTTYSTFLEDYLHFCQVPFEVVVLDDAISWMAAANGDPNSAIGSIWDNGVFAKNDQQTGLAGTTEGSCSCVSAGSTEWDFGLLADEITEDHVKDAWVGLTARHRIMTSAAVKMEHGSRSSGSGNAKVELAPVSGLVNFVAPHFAEITKEEWDRSRISSDAKSMEHFRNLVARSTIVHYCSEDTADDMMDIDDGTSIDLEQLAVQALSGKLDTPDRLHRHPVSIIPEVIPDDAFVADGKINFSRRNALSWLGPREQSWLRYELGKAKFQHILDAMKVSNKHGHFCEEITTASSTTSSGATGQVAGTMAYRLAIRCGRHFGSEQGLRQHVSALHAPPGTWLCRTCGSDCLTSQARTHHERSCGQSSPTTTATGAAGDSAGSTVGATPTVGQGGGSGKSGVGKKKGRGATASKQASSAEEKDPDGSFRVPGYRGVWVNKEGKHFVKIDGERVKKRDGSDELMLFDAIDDAAKKHDELVKAKKKGKKLELNFKPDGSRVIYEDITPASTSGLGGSAASVVPALSIINIKDLPPDVKPLLRDPRQTSRTGGNSKRHVYAYRGVCRQARKGHDRWQSQISFMGVNHYLGTFDSEWDAAAIYAWAHLILYGEEATKQAQKEGEEAAAAYEKEKRDIAAGKIPEPSPKQKKKPIKKEKGESATKEKGTTKKSDAPKKRKAGTTKETPNNEKKAKTNTKACKLEKEAIGSTVAKGVTKAPILAPRDTFEGVPDSELMQMVSSRILAAKQKGYCVSESANPPNNISVVESWIRPCIPTNKLSSPPMGAAMLVGLSPGWFGWDLQEFVSSQDKIYDPITAIQMLAVEYDEDGVNEKFNCIIQGTRTVIGRASEAAHQAYQALGLGAVPLGGTVGKVDCHIGGVPHSCSEYAACIRYIKTDESDFYLCAMSDDIVTLNGQRITPSSGCVALFDEDICTVGPRVFVFVRLTEH